MREIKSLLLSSFFTLSTLFSMGQEVKMTETEFINQLNQSGSTSLKIGNDPTPVNIHFESYIVIGDKISSHGTIVGVEQSNVMFKIDGKKVFGYALNIGENTGYYFESNDNGEVVISKVEASEYYHITKFKQTPTKQLEELEMPFANVQSAEYPYIQPYEAGMDLHALESKPGSPNVIFLDWRAVFNGNVPKHLTAEEMYEVWAGTASGYVSFDVNVTTSLSVYNSVPVTNSCIALFKDFDARSHAPGDSWGTANSSTIYTSTTSFWYVNTLVHEIGHQLGLDHDGAPHKEYFPGVDEYDWNSYMGHTWYGNFLQYSKGEYRDANNLEDDFEVIKGYIPYRNDEIGSVKNIIFGGDGATVNLQDNIGSIGLNIDEDTYTFTINEPRILSLKIEPLAYKSMLDIDARIEDDNGNVIVQQNIEFSRYAEFSNLLIEQPGTYKLIIKGGAEGTPEWGFSNYGSVGVYGVSGEIRKLESNEVRLVEVNPFTSPCNSYQPSVSIKNLGQQTINSMQLEVVVDNSNSELVNVNNLSISSLEETDINLNTLTQVGDEVPLRVIIKKINGVVPNKGNELAVNYTLGQGIGMELNFSDDAYPYTSWLIENSAGVKVADYNDVIVELNENGENKMRFCLTEECFKLKVSHELESCSDVTQWSGGTHQGGEVVIHEAKNEDGFYYTYTAKWWATGSNVPGGGDPWEQTGICTGPARGDFSLKGIGEFGNLVENPVGDNTDELSFEFCTSDITNSKEIKLGNANVFPNPFDDKLNVVLKNENITSIAVYDVRGAEIKVDYSLSANTATLDLNVPQGVYVIKIVGEYGNYSRVIKR